MLIRTATIEDLDAVTAVEAECFPPAEAATRSDLNSAWPITVTISGSCSMKISSLPL